MISVITVCYNSASTIRRTLDSMLAQTCKDYEYILIDGASKDGTVDILKEYEPRFEGRMRFISEPDKGIYDAMNKGIKQAKGDLIGLINSDDWYEPDALETALNARTGAKYEVVYGLLKVFKEGKEQRVFLIHHNYLKNMMIPHPTCFVTKECYRDMGVFDAEHYRCAADYDLMLRFSENSETVFTPVYKIMANFVLGGISSTIISKIEKAQVQYAHGILSKRAYLKTIFRLKKTQYIGKILSKIRH